MINVGWIAAAAAAHSVWWNFLFNVRTKGISVVSPMALWKMQPKSSSIFLFWLPYWAQTPGCRIMRITKSCCKDLARRRDYGTLKWGGWCATFKIMLGYHTTVLSQESHGNRGRQPVGILAVSEMHISKNVYEQGTKCGNTQPLAFPKFWDLAWCERKDCNYILLVDRIIYTWKEGGIGSNQEWQFCRGKASGYSLWKGVQN